MSLFRRISFNLILKKATEPRLGLILKQKCSTCQYTYNSDPSSKFLQKDVQTLLKSLTRVNLDRIYRKRKLGEPKLDKPVYKFFTDEQLRDAVEQAKRQADELLQMPPVLAPRKPIATILFEDPALRGFDTSDFIFTDITFGKSNAERLIVVRDMDGKLSKAEWELRDRMNQVYFPIVGRQLRTPRMFEADGLKRVLETKEYEFVLDRACVQFEPDDPKYHEVVHATYNWISEKGDFDAIRSTRHFGPCAFFLVWFKMADNLLLELIETGRIDEARDLVRLYGVVHGIEVNAEAPDAVEEFIKKYANKRGPLELALQAHKEVQRQRAEVEEGIRVAHGRT